MTSDPDVAIRLPAKRILNDWGLTPRGVNVVPYLIQHSMYHPLWEAEVLIERWRVEYTFKPHGSLDYRAPAPEAILTTWIIHSGQGGPLSLPGGKDTLPLT